MDADIIEGILKGGRERQKYENKLYEKYLYFIIQSLSLNLYVRRLLPNNEREIFYPSLLLGWTADAEEHRWSSSINYFVKNPFETITYNSK